MRHLDISTFRRMEALRALQLFTLPSAGLFLGLTLQQGELLFALLYLVLIIVSLGVLFGLRRRIHLRYLPGAYMAALLATQGPVFSRPDLFPGVEGWFGVMPTLAYLVQPLRQAPWVALGGMTLLSAAYVTGADLAPYRLSVGGLAQGLIPAFGIFVAAHLYARGRSRSDTRMFHRALTDPLTGLGNRDKLDGEFVKELERSQRTKMPLSVIILDLDHFKHLNDKYGHDAGDTALLHFSTILKRRIRKTDLACRMGGEEFAVILPDTPTAGAMTIAEDLRRTLEASAVHHGGHKIQFTVSGGVAELGVDGQDWSELYKAADAKLYACKKKGRNAIRCTMPDPS